MESDTSKTDALHEAFHRFTATSLKLDRSYRRLSGQVRRLKRELEKKNQALRDSVHEREVLREQAERHRRLAALGGMAVRMAHELRNPLGSIELFASLLRKALAQDREKAAWAVHISSGVKAMDYALSNILSFTRKPTARLRPADLKSIVDEAMLFTHYLIEQRQIRATRSISNPPSAFRCDPDLLKQVLVNLILNAVEAMPDGGELRIEIRGPEAPRGDTTVRSAGSHPEAAVTFRVSDTGPGIPAKILPKIFDPFFTSKKNGNGLGLAIVHNAIRAHHGTVRVESRSGKGTSFLLTLPLGTACNVRRRR